LNNVCSILVTSDFTLEKIKKKVSLLTQNVRKTFKKDKSLEDTIEFIQGNMKF